jgi:hypothetical protein
MSHLQHVRIVVHTGKIAGQDSRIRDFSRYHARTAGEVEYTLPVLRRCPADEFFGPGSKIHWHEGRFIAFRERGRVVRFRFVS